MLIKESIKNITQLIGDPTRNVPAGGPIIASTALLGVSLLKLSYNISQNEWSPNKKERLQQYQEKLNELEKELFVKMEADLTAYQKNLDNQGNNSQQLKSIIAIPLAIAKISTELLQITAQLKEEFHKKVEADLKIAILNLKASLKGALSIIKANSQLLPPTDSYLKQLKSEIAELKEKLQQL
ncbi:cyclodeaminase/cyclohydrolase family protein [Fuchsiella alkaliacetigena]|uniref:cyclodeaminase/cyclohydrolase family protein n=1 Tax=Fuchsiella alkaliacetigena TaxID=957042 RepID=UPI00200A0FC7|nr:cyclodeaminase/cyclohydrolase family protein [Fuchsiella alkaliacetigena]MCK8825796.1 cyclodeaminase/cyclohydrolase family protein [Fuchsiella alkaliacetigena]